MENVNATEIGKAERKIKVVTLCDHHDERFFLETMAEFAEAGTAHVRCLDSMLEGLENTFAVSNLPLSPRRTLRAFHEREIEFARENLRAGEDPHDVWDMCRVSAADVSRIAKEEGIALPRGWFQTGEKNAASTGAARAEIERMEELLAKARGDLAAASAGRRARRADVAAGQTA